MITTKNLIKVHNGGVHDNGHGASGQMLNYKHGTVMSTLSQQ